MKSFTDFIKNQNKKIVAGAGLFVLSALGFSLMIKAPMSDKNPVSESPLKTMKQDMIEAESLKQKAALQEKINGSLAVIDKRLLLVQKEMEKAAAQNKDLKSNKEINHLSETLLSFQEEAKRSLIQSHQENEILAKKIEALQEVIASLKGNDKGIQYLDKKALPFEVRAIDSVNEEPVLAINYNFKHIALEKGEKLAGWKVLHLDFSKQQAEFDDEKGAHVVLSLKDKSDGEKSWA